MKQKMPKGVNQITEGVIWKQLLLFFFPIVFGTLFQQIYNTADTVVVGRFVGKEALAAVGGSASQIANLLVGFFVGLSSGATVIISQFYGAKDEKNLKLTLHTAFGFSILAGIVIGLAGFFLSERLLEMMNTPSEVMKDSILYLHIYFAGILFNLIYNMGSGILRAVGDSKRPLYVLIVTCIMNILLDILLVVLFGMGVAGVAFATVLSQAVSAVLVVWMLVTTKEIYQLKISEIRVYKKHLTGFLRIGIPAGLESVMYNISNILIQVFVNNLGTDTVAAWGTLGKIDAFFWMVINAFSISITTFVGQNYGAGKFERMRKSVRVCMGMSLVSSVAISGLLLVFGRNIFGLFTTDSSVIRIGSHMINFLLPAYSIYVVIGILSGALRGAGKVLVPMLLTCGGVCTLRIIWLFTMMPGHPGIDTIMLSYPISWSITAVLFIVYYIKRFPRSHRQ
ncbi:MATE family efflux transporter [Ruminococcus sp. 5_1_39BFAA]|uniref:MATE family efflux transporter n=1 Tax=Ruminococcus sp. 5_1_39BFAA TaxID=457412 RepID=UPI00356A2013